MPFRQSALTLAFGFALVLASADAFAQIECGPGGGIRMDGVVYCGAEPLTTLGELAERVAPVLWFSPDEPLFDGRQPGDRTPSRLPKKFTGEAPPSATETIHVVAPVVYYGIRELVFRRGTARPSIPTERRDPALHAWFRKDTPVDLSQLTRVTVRFAFYYPADAGFGGHAHDLEYADFVLSISSHPLPGSRCRFQVSIVRVEAAAHGSRWYSNVLDIGEDNADGDLSFPITLLVEEGKHAVATDRNGDGHFTPRYDVNRRVNEAWGVRDNIRSGDVAAPRYEAAQAKPRKPNGRVGPRGVHLTPECLYAAYRGDASMLKYELEVFPWAGAYDCSDIESRGFKFCDVVRERHQSRPFVRIGEASRLYGLVTSVLDDGSILDTTSVAARRDGDRVGFALVYPILALEFPKVGGWVYPRIFGLRNSDGSDAIYSVGIDALYTPSLSRWLDWYASVGARALTPDRPGAKTTVVREYEGGVRLRFKKWGTFQGARLGMRWEGFKHVTNQRMTFELGIGVW